jgi:uridine phosphorylase
MTDGAWSGQLTIEPFPLLQHALGSPSAFTPERLMAAVQAGRGLPQVTVPRLCVLDFDGDLSDHLVAEGISLPWSPWACFHTSMRTTTMEGITCGIVPRTIGGPYAVLISEQLWAAGAKLIVGITSAGRVSANLPLPSIVVVDEAVRDEGTSLHYVAAATTISTPTADILDRLVEELGSVSPATRRGRVWTTDAPYRETAEQLRFWSDRNTLAVEMQAASLFAFAHARGAQVAMVALVSNAVDQLTSDFDTGGNEYRVCVLRAVARAARPYVVPRSDTQRD